MSALFFREIAELDVLIAAGVILKSRLSPKSENFSRVMMSPAAADSAPPVWLMLRTPSAIFQPALGKSSPCALRQPALDLPSHSSRQPAGCAAALDPAVEVFAVEEIRPAIVGHGKSGCREQHEGGAEVIHGFSLFEN